MKLALLCNNTVAYPALQQLHTQGITMHVGADAANNELLPALQQYCTDLGFSFTAFEANKFNEQLHAWLDDVQPEAVLMMTCPFRIPENALAKPKHGFINFHYGLLPYYRGANPVFEQLKRRENNGGITVHHVDKGIDTGAVILQQKIPVHPDETFGMHMGRLSMLGAEMVRSLTSMIASGNALPRIPQDEMKACYYKKPGTNDVLIKWETMQAEDIIALANACNPWNFGAGTQLNGNMLGVNAAVVLDNEVAPTGKRPGTIIAIDTANGLRVVSAGQKMLRLDIVYVNNSFMPGYKLAMFGVRAGMNFN
ncbi:methionyl-tRNA formyltransferase [Chitinophagaceae bacterium MMS25-I14]